MCYALQTTPVVAGLVIGAGAYAAKFALEAAMKIRASSGPNLKRFYKVRPLTPQHSLPDRLAPLSGGVLVTSAKSLHATKADE